MKNLRISLSVSAAMALATVMTANATDYNLSYTADTADGTVANGELTVVNGLATGGYLDVTSGPDIGDYTLVSAIGSDSSFVYDTYVYPGSDNGFLDTTAGLLWSASGDAGDSSEVNMWFNLNAQYGAPADTYSFWGAPGNWNLESYGSATLTPALQTFNGGNPAQAADGGSTMAMLASGLTGLMALRRKFVR
jgi:hypothetical protein